MIKKHKIFVSVYVIVIVCSFSFVVHEILGPKKWQQSEGVHNAQNGSIQTNGNISINFAKKREIKPEALAAERKGREQFLKNYHDKVAAMGQRNNAQSQKPLTSNIAGIDGYNRDGVSLQMPDSQIAYSRKFNNPGKSLNFEEEMAKRKAELPIAKSMNKTLQKSGRKESIQTRIQRLKKEFIRHFGKSQSTASTRAAKSREKTVIGNITNSSASTPTEIGIMPSPPEAKAAILGNDMLNKELLTPVKVNGNTQTLLIIK